MLKNSLSGVMRFRSFWAVFVGRIVFAGFLAYCRAGFNRTSWAKGSPCGELLVFVGRRPFRSSSPGHRPGKPIRFIVVRPNGPQLEWLRPVGPCNIFNGDHNPGRCPGLSGQAPSGPSASNTPRQCDSWLSGLAASIWSQRISESESVSAVQESFRGHAILGHQLFRGGIIGRNTGRRDRLARRDPSSHVEIQRQQLG